MKTGVKHILFILTSSLILFSCAKEYSSEKPLTPGGSWQFTEGSHNYAGQIQSVYSTNGGNSNQLMLTGKSNFGNQIFQLTIYADSIQTGTYKASNYQSSLLYESSSTPIYQANGGFGEFIVNITVHGNKVSGNFSGTAQDSTGNSVTISNGKFQVQ